MSYVLRHTAVIKALRIETNLASAVLFCNASTSPDSGPAPVNDILLLKEGVFAAVVLRKSSIHTEHIKTQRRE